MPANLIRSSAAMFVGATLLLLSGAATLTAAAATTGADDDAAKSTAAPPAAWRLSDLYSTPEAWTAAYDKAIAAAQGLDHYRGSLGQSSAALYSALDAISNLRRESDRLAVYASLKADEDSRIAINQERRQQARS